MDLETAASAYLEDCGISGDTMQEVIIECDHVGSMYLVDIMVGFVQSLRKTSEQGARPANVTQPTQPAICPLHVPGNVCRWGHGYRCGASPCRDTGKQQAGA